MSAEISILLDTRRAKKRGVYPVKLRAYFDGKPELFQTTFNLTEENYNKLKARRMSNELLAVRNELEALKKAGQTAADAIDPFDFQAFYKQFIYGNRHFKQKRVKVKQLVEKNEEEGFDESMLKKFPILKENHPGPDFISAVYQKIIKSLVKQGRIGNAIVYHCSYVSFIKFSGNVRFKQINSQFLHEYEAWMMNANASSKTTVGMYMRSLRAVYKEAISDKLIRQDHYPFHRNKYGIPSGRNIKKAMNRQAIANLYNTVTEKQNAERLKDFWFFIFYANGMNVKDFIHLKFKNIQGDFLIYERAKTQLTSRGKEPIVISIYLTQEMRDIIKKWGNHDDNPDDYIFPILKSGCSPLEQYKIKYNFTKLINRYMTKLGEKAKTPRKPLSMEARHSASTILKNAGVSTHFIKESLGHASLKTTENYLGAFEDDQKREYANILADVKGLATVSSST